MHVHHYHIVTEDGDIILSITSSFTNLASDVYAEKFIVPLLPPISAVEGEKVFYDHTITQ